MPGVLMNPGGDTGDGIEDSEGIKDDDGEGNCGKVLVIGEDGIEDIGV